MPDPRLIGTYNQVDRSAQYTGTNNGELLHSLNEAWSKIRLVEKARAADAVIIARLRQENRVFRFKNIALTSILTGLAWEGAKVVLPIVARWLGFI